MSNKQTLQNIWSITDKPLIDLMKTKQTVPNYSNDSSDSESEDSSKGSFTAVPREFRPNLSPQLTKKKHESSQLLHNRKLVIHNKKPATSEYPKNKLNHPPTENTKFIPVKCIQGMHPKSTPNMKRYKTCPQRAKNMSSVKNTQRDAKKGNDETIRNTTISNIKQQANNSTSFANQSSISTSSKNKPRNRLQYEHVLKECGPIQINFDPSTGKKPIIKEGLEYEAIILKNENTNSYSETRQDNFQKQHKDVVPEHNVKWDSSLRFDLQNDHYNKIEKTIITHNKTQFIPKRERHTGKKNINNNSNHTNFNQVKKPLKENHNQRKFNNSIEENNFNQNKKTFFPNEIKFKKLENNFEEKEYDLETPFCKNNVQLHKNRNRTRTKIQNSKINAEMLSATEDFTYQCSIKSEQNTAYNQEKYPNLLNITTYNLPSPSVAKILQEFIQHKKENSKLNSSDYKKVKGIEEMKSILDYGKDMSDLIIGSHTALSIFISLHKDWKITRQELIKHFELLEKNLKESSKKFIGFREMINVANTGATIAATIPHPTALIASKIVSLFTSLFTVFMNKPNKDITKDTNEITTCLFKDTQASSKFYMHGLQCNQQFGETTKLIEEFYSTASKYKLFEIENSEIVEFVQGILEYKPAHRIFYKKLWKCFQELMENGSSSDAKKLCEPFMLHTSAIDVIGYLDWRFPYQKFNSESVRNELEQLHQLIQDSNSTSLKDLIKRIQNCIRILNDELEFVERSFKDISLFDTFSRQSITKYSLQFSGK